MVLKGQFVFQRLVTRLILAIPHSNAEEEMIFSTVRKNKTCFLRNLDPQETLASIVRVKLAMEAKNLECFEIPDEILRRNAKSATYRYKLEHLSTT